MTKRLDKQHSRRAPSRRRRQEQRVRGVLTRLRTVGKVARQHHFITLVIGICLVCLVIWGIVALRTRPQIGPAVGNRAPDFTVQTIDGEGIIKEVKEGRFRSQEEIESIISSIIAGE